MRRKSKFKSKVLSAALCLMMVMSTGYTAFAADTGKSSETGDLTLKVKVTSGTEYSVDLTWNDISTDTTKYGYHILRSSDNGKTWETRSSWNVGDVVKVLNVYPNYSSKNYLINWMSRVVDSETGQPAGKGLFEIDTVQIDDYNKNADSYLLDENGEYKYDVVFFGSYDSNGGKDLTEASFQCTQKFIDSGRGVLFGHDTVCLVNTTQDHHEVFAQFADQLGIIATDYFEQPDRTSKANVVKTGLLTGFPWLIEGELDIPTTHVWGQYSGGDLPCTVWMTLQNQYPEPSSVYTEYAKRGLKRNAYLVSRNQLAMIQTGHSNGQASDDECKVFANTLFYLKQLTVTTSARDNSFYDITAPQKPTVKVSIDQLKGEQYSVTADIQTKDLGTDYQYRTEAIPYAEGDKVNSNIVNAQAFSGLKGFIVITTETEDSAKDLIEYQEDGKTLKNVIASEDGIIEYKAESLEKDKNYYLHVFAVDYAGNFSEETVYEIASDEILTGRWMQEGPGWWYQNVDGTYPKDTWMEISGKWYHFDVRGYMMTGWYKSGNYWYYLKTNGAMATNTWVDDDFYVDEDGKWVEGKEKVEAGWKHDEKGWWYVNEDGSYPKNQWKKIGEKWYHFDENGYMQTGWYKEGDTYYYLKEDGSMAVDEWIQDKYYLDENGKWVEGKEKTSGTWKQDSKGWWYVNEDGSYPKNQWKKIGEKWYHFDENGYMQTGWYKEGDYYYYLKADGSMACDEWVENDRYYIDANGHWMQDVVIIEDVR